MRMHNHTPEQTRGRTKKGHPLTKVFNVTHVYKAMTEAIFDEDYRTKLQESCTIQSKPQQTFTLKGRRSTVSLDFHSKMQCAAMRGNWVLKTLKDVDLLRPQCTRNDFTNNNLIMIFTVYYDVL